MLSKHGEYGDGDEVIHDCVDVAAKIVLFFNLVRRRVWSRSVGVHCVHLEIDVFNLATSINSLTLNNLHFFLLSLLMDS